MLSWGLFDDGRRVQSGELDGQTPRGTLGDVVERELGGFQAEPGHLYIVEVGVTGNASVLAGASPKILVRRRSLRE